jgi:hypothetical protein
MRRARRRGRVLVRSFLLHVLVLALVGLGLLARMSESSDVQLAAAEHAAALARLDAAPSASSHARGWSRPAQRGDLSLPGAPPPVSSRLELAASAAGGAPVDTGAAAQSLARSASAPSE